MSPFYPHKKIIDKKSKYAQNQPSKRISKNSFLKHSIIWKHLITEPIVLNNLAVHHDYLFSL